MKASKSILILATVITALFVSGWTVSAAEKNDKKAEKKDEAAKPKPYPLNTCIVMDDKLDKDAFAFVHKGQEIKLCCEGCKEDFDKAPAKYLKKLEKSAKK